MTKYHTRRSFMMNTASCIAVSLGDGLGADLARGQSNGSPISNSSDLIKRERQAIQSTMAQANVEGIAVCLLQDGRSVWTEGFGTTNGTNSEAVTADTIFSIQSTSKNLTATAIMLSVQQGLLDLDVPITKYLANFTVNSRFETRPQDRITLRHLLSHRAGFTHEAPVGNNYYPQFPSFEAHVRSISDTWLRFPVGQRYRYSNLGFDLAGYILQVRTGTPFASWVQKELFDPLGMTKSTFAIEVYEARANRAIGHANGHPSVPLQTPLIPSGGAYVSARDMATYSMFHLGKGKINGKTILREELWNEMHGFALGGDYGLGVIRSEVCYGATPLRLLTHKGGGFGFGSVFAYCPEARLAWAAFFNRPSGPCYGFGENLIAGILSELYGKRRPRLSLAGLSPIALTPLQRQEFVGNYISRNSSVDVLVDGNQLKQQEDGSSSVMHFTSPTDVAIVDTDSEVVEYRYYPETASEPAHLECSIGEISLDANRGPHDAPGHARSEWSHYLGEYTLQQWGIPALKVTIREDDGFLFLNNIRLVTESEPGLFFTSDGEAVDFRHKRVTWKNLRLTRKER